MLVRCIVVLEGILDKVNKHIKDSCHNTKTMHKSIVCLSLTSLTTFERSCSSAEFSH